MEGLDLDATMQSMPSTKISTSMGLSGRQSMIPPKPMLFVNPSHPLSGFPDNLSKADFVDEVRKRLRVAAMFSPQSSREPTLEPVLSAEEAELLFDVLGLLQDPLGNSSVLRTGRNLDVSVEQFFALHRLRAVVERNFPSMTAFFNAVDLDDSKVLEVGEIKHFIKTMLSAGDRKGANFMVAGVEASRLAEIFMDVLDVDRTNGVHFWELRRQLALVAPPGASQVELISHFELKYGTGRTGTNELLDCKKFFTRLCQVEQMDIAPEDLARFYANWRGNQHMLQPASFQAAVGRLPLEVTWGDSVDASDRLFCAMGIRALQKERQRKMDAPLPKEAVVSPRIPDDLQQEADVRAGFERLWAGCVGTEAPWNGAGAGASLAEEVREGVWSRYSAAVQDTLQAFADASAAHSSDPPRLTTRSLFPNIVDVMAIPSTRLFAGQTFLVRYRLTGAANFVHSEPSGVLQDGREPLSWPVSRDVLGDTPFIGLVPRGLRWTIAGGGGFYLGKEPFSNVDPGLRADLPREGTTGRTQLYGCVELVPPSMLRGSSAAGPQVADYELRLFCARSKKIIGCVGEPIHVTVEQRIFASPMETIQVRLDGRRAVVRWATLALGSQAPDATTKEVRLQMRGGKVERDMTLDPDVTEWETQDLVQDQEYEFRVRLQGVSVPGRESTVTCRTNARCSEPKALQRYAAGTAHVEISWEPPDTLGNEVTRDRVQTNPEAIIRYEATLRVEDPEAAKKVKEITTQDADGDRDESGEPESNRRACWWSAGSWRQGKDGRQDAKYVIAHLGGLRPDVRYSLQGFCAVNSMGPGVAAKTLIFHTLPQTPVITDVRVKGERVIIWVLLAGANKMEFEITVALTSRPKDIRTFSSVLTETKTALAEGQPYDLLLPFAQMALGEPNGTHTVRLRAKNAGGWSEWADKCETIAIVRQQGAEAAQARLVEAIEHRDIDSLAQVLKEVQGIEFSDTRPINEATELLNVLLSARNELREAEKAREPARLAVALKKAREVILPDLEGVEHLLEVLVEAKERLDTAKGIVDLKAALERGYEVRLPVEILRAVVERLGTREAALQNLILAMEAARVPILASALDALEGMALPEEDQGRRLLDALTVSELLLRSALETGMISDLAAALESAAESGLREEELIAEVAQLKEDLEAERGRASESLAAAIAGRYPEELTVAIAWSKSAQVAEDEVSLAVDLLKHLESRLFDVAAAVGIEERDESLQASRESRVPESLIAAAVVQLGRLRNVHAAHDNGDVPMTRATLRLAADDGVKERELVDIRLKYHEWTLRNRDVEIAASLARTDMLRVATDEALRAGINPQQLVWAEQTYEAFLRRDGSKIRLLQGIEKRKVEYLQRLMMYAADCNLQDRALMSKARFLLSRLRFLRARIVQAMKGRELGRLFDALVECTTAPQLPTEDLEDAQDLLEELRWEELQIFNRRSLQARQERDFRQLDALVVRGKWLIRHGVQIASARVLEAAKMSMSMQAEDRLEIQNEEHGHRYLGCDNAEGFGVGTTYNKIQPEHDFANVPFEVVLGEIHLSFQPTGKHLFVLPREIVQAQVSVVAEENRGEGSVDYNKAGATCDRLVSNIRGMLENTDSIRQISKYEVRHDGAHHRLELDLAIYLRADHTAIDVVEAIYQDGLLDQADVKEKKVEEAEAKVGAVTSAATGVVMSPVPGSQTGPVLPGVRHDAFSSVVDQLSAHLSQHIAGLVMGEVPQRSVGSGCLRNLHARVMRRLTLDMSWDYPAGLMDTLDASIILMDSEQMLDIVMQNTKKQVYGSHDDKYACWVSPGELDGVVKHVASEQSPMQRTGRKLMELRMDLLPERVSDIVLIMSAHNSRDLTKFQNMRLRVIDSNANVELAYFPMGNGGRAETVICCTLNLLSDGLWHIHGMGHICRGTLRDFRPILDKLLLLGYPRNVSMRSQMPHILGALEKSLALPRPVKCTRQTVTPENMLKVRYVVELVEGEALPGEGDVVAQKLGEKEALKEIVETLRGTADDRFLRFNFQHLAMLPRIVRPFTKMFVELAWSYPTEEDMASEDRDSRFLDTTIICFAGRSLQEVVDYRGAHGVRLVHNGIYDDAGVWLGKMGVGDATGGAVRHLGENFDDLKERGEQVMSVNLQALPPTTTDVFVVVSTGVFAEVNAYRDIKCTLRDAENPGHEVLKVEMPSSGVSVEGAVMCRLGRCPGNFWQLGSFRSGCGGTVADYRSMIQHLRNIQERKHRETTSSPFTVSRLQPRVAAGPSDSNASPLDKFKTAARRASNKGGQPALHGAGAGVRPSQLDLTQKIVNTRTSLHGDRPSIAEE